MRSCALASALLALVAVLLGAAKAPATPVIFTDETSFYAVMGGANLAIAGFDTGPFAVAPDALVFGDLSVKTESEGDSASQGDFTLGFAAPIQGMAIDALPLFDAFVDQTGAPPAVRSPGRVEDATDFSSP